MKELMKKLLASALSVLMLTGTAVLSAAATLDEADPSVLYVTKDEVEDRGFYSAVQSALYQASELAASGNHYTVVAPAGEYDLYSAFHIYSNTTLDLSGVTLKRSNGGNMLRVGGEDGVASGVTGYAYENIRVVGGVFDGNYGDNTIIKAFHTKNFTMEDVTLLHETDGHMTEFAGVDGLTIRGCVFRDQILNPKKYGYEAIQLDVLHPFHITNGRCEDLPITNARIEYCIFDNVPRAIGSHTSVHNLPHDNITIRGNIFSNLGSIAVQGMNWTNVDIRSNYIEDAPRGITVYAEPAGCTYLSSKLAAKGGTASHASDSYLKPSKANINIAYNVLVNVGSKDDGYASYSSQGIAVLGEKLTAKSPVDSGDESGGLPAGDYYIDGVSIHDNFIDIRGNGIRVEDARNVEVKSNEILCTKNTVHDDNYYGIVLRDNVTATAVSYNTVKNAEVNGIQLDGTRGGSVDMVQYNRIEGTGKYGIAAYTMKLGKIYDNDIIGTKNRGLFLAEKTSAQEMKWNRVRNCSAEGIWVTSDSSASAVKSNTIVKCSGNRQYGNCTDTNPYTSSKSPEKFYIPWDTERSGAAMGVGSMFKIVPDIRPTNAFADFTYTSSDEEVVMVDANGMVYATGEGYATVTVTSGNGIKKTYPVAVEGDGEVSHLTMSPAVPVLLRGDADGNGAIESVDATVVQRTLAYVDTPYSPYTLLHGDVDGSGDLELTDASYIQYYLAGFSTPYGIGKSLK